MVRLHWSSQGTGVRNWALLSELKRAEPHGLALGGQPLPRTLKTGTLIRNLSYGNASSSPKKELRSSHWQTWMTNTVLHHYVMSLTNTKLGKCLVSQEYFTIPTILPPDPQPSSLRSSPSQKKRVDLCPWKKPQRSCSSATATAPDGHLLKRLLLPG